MKGRLSILGAAAVIAASLWGAAPARAAESEVCRLMVPEQTVVVTGPGVINVYPSNAGPYASTVVAGVRAWVNCIYNENAGPVVACVNQFVVNRPTVSVDPITLAITIDYSQFLGTTCTL